MKFTPSLLIATAMTMASLSIANANPVLDQIERATDGLYEPVSYSVNGVTYSPSAQRALNQVEASTDGLYEPPQASLHRVDIASFEVGHHPHARALESSLEAVRVNLQDIDD